MKNFDRMASSALVIALLFALFSLYSCSGYDPNVLYSLNEYDPNGRVEENTEAKEGVSVAVTEKNTEAPEADSGEYVCIGGGRDQTRDVNGVTVDVGAFALRSYELCFLLGQSGFSDPSEISLDPAVLFAFCHLYYDELWSMPNGGNLLCTASEDEITGKLAEYFGDAGFDVKKSEYYSSLSGEFEMFAPTQFGTSVYYNVDSAEFASGSGDFEIYTTFYKDSGKTTVLGRTVLTLKTADGRATIASMTSEY